MSIPNTNHSNKECDSKITLRYPQSDTVFANAQMGYAPDVGSVCTKEVTLRYLFLTWREAEPLEESYAWDAIEEKYQLDTLRKKGIHLVLRFVCDYPGTEKHMDIPDWLYEKTSAGGWYDTSYGRGYSPDYSDPVFRAAHRRMISALAAHFDDGFASYVELGSLGHWGEWHVQSAEGSSLPPMPEESVRDQYVQDYLDAFHHARLLMRRPFRVAAKKGLGLYNDMTGDAEGTGGWLGWIQSGGWYGMDPYALTAMPECWKTSPIGGEFASCVPMKELLDTNLSATLTQIQNSHMSFLGPLSAEESFSSGYDAVLLHLGYRLFIPELRLVSSGRETAVTLVFRNDGAAPFYWDWPVNLYVETEGGDTLQTIPLSISLPELLPGKEMTVTAILESGKNDIFRLLERHAACLTIGIVDPITGRDAVRFAMDARERNGRVILLS